MSNVQSPAMRVRSISIIELRKFADSGHLFALVDSCNAPLVPQKVMELGEQRGVSLYRGSAEEEFWDVAPYLITLDKAVLEWILMKTPKERWGIFIISKASIEILRRHLRHFLKVKAPGGEVWLFRFFDPRVLRLFLPACLEDELHTFLGPVLAYGVTLDMKSVTLYQGNHPAGMTEQQTTAPGYSFMFRLRLPHLEALRVQMESAFVEETLNFLRTKHGRFVAEVEEDKLRQRVIIGLTRARRYGFKQRSSLAGFLAIMFRVAPNFDEHPSISAVLTDARVPPDLRISELWSRTTEKDWEEVSEGADPATWKC